MLTWGAQPFSKHVVGPVLGHRIVLIQLIQEEVALTQLDPGRQAHVLVTPGQQPRILQLHTNEDMGGARWGVKPRLHNNGGGW